MGTSVRLRFADFELDAGARRLTRGTVDVHLSPKAFELLTALVERRPNAVSKQELQERLWPATFVAESNLPALVNELRTTLEDSAQRPRFVRTVPRFGYAFCADVPSSDATETRGDGFGCWLILKNGRIELTEGENIVGRDPRAQAWIDLPSVSRRHARIVIDGGEARLEDLGSKNGTSVRGQRIDSPVLLQDHDPIIFGAIQATFRAWRAPEEVDTSTV
jgi:DNA-binding winged helix-turn-helix (wHTH) protein